MQIITFYSFKGGVGRSNLLYNVAYLLAAKHRARVVISDWDLHAPGLTCLYDMQDPDGPILRNGLVDVLTDLADEVKVNADQITDPIDLVQPTRIGRRIQEENPDAGDIWFFPAGAFSDDDMKAGGYRDKVQALRSHLPALAKRGHKELLPWVADRIEARFAKEKKKPDYLLLDARTGLTEVGDLLMSKATNRVVVVFGLNDQNIEGMGHTLRWLLKDVGAANIASQVVLVASPVPNGEEHVKQQKRRRIDDLVTSIVSKASEEVGVTPVTPKRFEVPYHPLIALTERPLAEVYPESEPAKAFHMVTDYLRNRPLQAEAVQQAIQLRVREEQATRGKDDSNDKKPASMRTSADDEHPMARQLSWNVVHPKATSDMLLRVTLSHGDELLNGLANSVSLSREDKSKMLDQTPKVPVLQIRGMLHILDAERSELMAMEKSGWPQLASLRAMHWVDWMLESARRLDVPLVVAAQRLVDALSNSSESAMNSSVALAVAEQLAKKSGQFGDALRVLLERVVEANPMDGTVLAQAGLRSILIGDIERGTEWFQRAAVSSRDKHDVEFFWGYALQERANTMFEGTPAQVTALLINAEAHYRKALELRPEMHAAANNLGAAVMARATLHTERDPEQALALLAEAETHYRRVVEIKPDEYQAESNWGNVVFARALLCLKSDPEQALALFAEAEAHYRRAVEIKPDNHDAERNWGNLIANRAMLYRERDPEQALALFKKAETHFRRAAEIRPEKYEAEYAWGNVLRDRAPLTLKSDPEQALALFAEAETHYRRVVEIKPDMHEAEYNWGFALLERAKLCQKRDPEQALVLFAEAETHFRRVVEIKPHAHEAEDSLVAALCWQTHVLKSLGRPDDATRLAKAALDVAQRHVKTIGKPTYNLACALAQTGDIEQAFATLEELSGNGELKNPAWLREDPDLAPLREDARFEALVKTLEAQQTAT